MKSKILNFNLVYKQYEFNLQLGKWMNVFKRIFMFRTLDLRTEALDLTPALRGVGWKKSLFFKRFGKDGKESGKWGEFLNSFNNFLKGSLCHESL